MRMFTAFVFGITLLGRVSAQSNAATTPSAASPRWDAVHQVDMGQMYQRVYAIVPMVGSNTKNDPKRPMFVPMATKGQSPNAVHTGVIGFQMWPSDDGNFALVEFVGATPHDLQPIISAAGANVIVFERGKHTQAEIETAFQSYKKGFTFGWSTVRVQ